MLTLPAPERSARRKAGSRLYIKVIQVLQDKDKPILAGIYKDSVQTGKPLNIYVQGFFNNYAVEYDEHAGAQAEVSGSQRNTVAEMIVNLDRYPKAKKWFLTTESVVLDAQGDEAVLRVTLVRAMEGRAGPGPEGILAEEEMARLLSSMEELIGAWADSPGMSQFKELGEMHEKSEKQTPKKRLAMGCSIYGQASTGRRRERPEEESQVES